MESSLAKKTNNVQAYSRKLHAQRARRRPHDGQFAAERLEFERIHRHSVFVEQHVRRRQRRVTAENHFRRRREPTQAIRAQRRINRRHVR